MPAVISFGPGFKAPTEGQAWPQAPLNALTAATDLLSLGCLAARERLAEAQKFETQKSSLELSALSSAVANVRTAIDDRRAWPSLKHLLPPDWSTPPTSAAAAAPLHLTHHQTSSAATAAAAASAVSVNVSSRWRPTETARERVASRVEERLAAAYIAAEAEAMRVRAMHPPLELAPLQEDPFDPQQLRALSPADLAKGRSLEYEYPDAEAHPGAWGVSAAPHFIPELAGDGRGSPIQPPHGRWPAAETEGGAMAKLQRAVASPPRTAASIDQMEAEAAERERAMVEAARAVLGEGGGSVDLPGLSMGGTSYAASYDDPSRALSRLSALSAIGMDDTPEGRRAARAAAAGLATSVGVSDVPARRCSDPSASLHAAPMYDPYLADTRSATTILAGGAGMGVGFAGIGQPACPTGGAAQPTLPAATGGVSGPTNAASGSAMLATMLNDPFSPSKGIGAGGFRRESAPVPAMAGLAAINEKVNRRNSASAQERALSLGGAVQTGAASKQLQRRSKSKDGVASASSPLGQLLGGGSVVIGGQAVPVGGSADEDEYEYYEAIDETNPAVAEFRRLVSVAEAARSRLEVATVAEEAAAKEVTAAERECATAASVGEEIASKHEEVTRLEAEVTAARAHEAGLRRMVGQHEQTLEDLRLRLDAAKRKKFGSSKERNTAQRLVHEEAAKMKAAKERLDTSLSKLNALLAQVDGAATAADESQAKADAATAQANANLEGARARLALAEAERREAESVCADSAATAERERMLLVGQGALPANMETLSTSFKGNDRALSVGDVAAAFASAPSALASRFTTTLRRTSSGAGGTPASAAAAATPYASIAPSPADALTAAAAAHAIAAQSTAPPPLQSAPLAPSYAPPRAPSQPLAASTFLNRPPVAQPAVPPTATFAPSAFAPAAMRMPAPLVSLEEEDLGEYEYEEEGYSEDEYEDELYDDEEEEEVGQMSLPHPSGVGGASRATTGSSMYG